ncbi:hypothetical protein GEMRC1_007919 [Eukaryota sp. GEM-RC1]
MVPISSKILFAAITGLNELVFRHVIVHIGVPVFLFLLTIFSLYSDSIALRRINSLCHAVLHLSGAAMYYTVPHFSSSHPVWLTILSGPVIVGILFILESIRFSPTLCYRVHRSLRRRTLGLIITIWALVFFSVTGPFLSRSLNKLTPFGWPSCASLFSIGVILTANHKGTNGSSILMVLCVLA